MMRLRPLTYLLVSICCFVAPRVDAQSDFAGKWQSATVATGQHHGSVMHEFSGDQATLTFFMHNALPFQRRAVKLIRYGRFRVVGPSLTVPGAFEVDVQVERITLTMLDPDSVWLGNFNDSDECGLRDWVIGAPRDVTGRRCPNPMSAAGDVEKILMKREGDVLSVSPYWGEGAVVPGPPASAVRATSLDAKVPLLRVTTNP